MSLDAAYDAIRARIEAAWPGIEPTVPLAFKNENFQPPRSTDTKGTPLPWVLIDVKWSPGPPSGLASIGAPGANFSRRGGNIWCHAFVAQGTGEARAMQLAAEAGGVFEQQDFNPVDCWSILPGGDNSGTEDGLYYGQSVAVPFWIDDIPGVVSGPTSPPAPPPPPPPAPVGTEPYVFLGGLTTYALPNGSAVGQRVGIKDDAGTAASVQPIITGIFDGGATTFTGFNQNFASYEFVWNGTLWSVF